MPRLWLVAIFLLHSNVFASSIERSVSTSVAGMEELLKTEEILVKSLSNFADELEKKLSTIRSAVKKMSEEIEKAKPDSEAYLANPLNAFSLVRRMHADWVDWIEFLNRPIGIEHLNTLSDELLRVQPTETDLIEAVNAIGRLQQTYDLKEADMAAGLLNGKKYDVKLSTLDLFTIGYALFKQFQYFEASFWTFEALQSFEESDINAALGLKKAKIIQFYAEVLVKLNRYKDAVTLLDMAIDLHSKDVSLLHRKAEIEFQIVTNNEQPRQRAKQNPSAYQLGCRGSFPYRTNSLYCRYNTTTHSFLKLAPIKMEEISLDPYMILFYDVISDDEIAHLKEIGQPDLKRATVYNPTEGKSVVVPTRTSKFSWLKDNTTDITKRINQRIADMTGFDLRGSEMLQVMNYGLGGHYDSHYDYFNFSMNSEALFKDGDRMSTVLFYMSDVEQGGATVFPELKIAVYPKKGSAVMWYNLNDRGIGDPRTIHAACPVIVGSKWVCNKWIRERSQWRTRICLKE